MVFGYKLAVGLGLDVHRVIRTSLFDYESRIAQWRSTDDQRHLGLS
jgi:hypothetical protein